MWLLNRPAYPTEVMVRILVLKRLYNLSDEQMEFQLLDRNKIWRIGEDGATALFHGVDEQLHRHGFIARGGQAIYATQVPAPVQHIGRDDRRQFEAVQQPAHCIQKLRPPQRRQGPESTQSPGRSLFWHRN